MENLSNNGLKLTGLKILQKKSFLGPKNKIPVAIVVFLIHLLGYDNSYLFADAILAGLGGVLTYLVFAEFLSSKREELPILVWVFSILYVFYFLPIFLPGIDYRIISYEILKGSSSITNALIAVLLFMLLVIVGSSLAVNFLKSLNNSSLLKNKKYSRNTSISITMLGALSAISILVNLSIYYLMRDPPWYFFLLITFASTNLFLLLWLHEIKINPTEKKLKIGLVIYFVSVVAIALITSRLEQIVLPFVILIVVRLGITKTIAFRYLALALMLVVFINPAKYVYRGLSGFALGQIENVSLLTVLDRWIDSIESVWLSDDPHSLVTNEQTQRYHSNIVSRFNYLSLTAATFYKCPDGVPHSMGSTWLVGLTNLIPRFLWTGKPNLKEVTNDYFNVSFGFQSWSHARYTTLAFPIIVDGYWAFGWFGIALVGLLLGVLIGVTQYIFLMEGRLYWILSYIILLNIKPTDSLAAIFSGIPQTVFAVIVIVLLLETFNKYNKNYYGLRHRGKKYV